MDTRLLALWMEDLSVEVLDGSTLRMTASLLEALRVICPFTDAPRWGLFTLPLRGPSRFYGGDDVVIELVLTCAHEVSGVPGRVGVADGLWPAELAAREAVVVALGATDVFRRRQPIEALGRRDIATVGRRLGLRTVGEFAALEPARVAERFNAHAVELHRLARGEITEAPGQRDLTLARRLGLVAEVVAPDEQLGFFGGRGAGDERADAAARRARHRVGVAGVVRARHRGGHAPEDRAEFVPFDAPPAPSERMAPWPGHHPAPAPTTSIVEPAPVALLDRRGVSVSVGVRGALSSEPARLGFASGLVTEVIWWAGPWPLVERWWETPRRRAHLQVLTRDGRAFLLVFEATRWWLAGVYD